MSTTLAIALVIIVPVIAFVNYRKLPKCKWCHSRNTVQYRAKIKDIRWCKNCHTHFPWEEKK